MRFVTAIVARKRTARRGGDWPDAWFGWWYEGNTFILSRAVSDGREGAATTGVTPSPPMDEHTPLIRRGQQFIGNNDERWLKVCACIATVVLGTVILAASKTDGPGSAVVGGVPGLGSARGWAARGEGDAVGRFAKELADAHRRGELGEPQYDPSSLFARPPGRRAPVDEVDGSGAPLTLPWQPVSLGGPAAASRDVRWSAGASGPAIASRKALGVVAGHGLHCDLRSTPWLLSELHPDVPSAVFGSRGGGVVDDGLHSSPARWMETAMGEDAAASRDAESRLGGEDPLADALSDRLGFQAQGGDFANVASSAGFDAAIAVGESMSTAAALWGALEQAERDLGLLPMAPSASGQNTESPKPRIKGLVLTLVPSMGSEREEYWNEMMRVLRATYGSVDNATTSLSKDCSIGYGCIPFAKFVAAKHSNLPTPTRLARIAQAGIPAVVFGNHADEPAHPVENGRVVAQALGATFHEASTHEEALAKWPGVIADFVNGIARDEGIVLAPGAADSTTGATGEIVAGVVAPRDWLRATRQLCSGDPTTTPELVDACESYRSGESAVPPGVEAAVEAREASLGKDKYAATTPFYRRTGLDVSDCVTSGVVTRSEVSDLTSGSPDQWAATSEAIEDVERVVDLQAERTW